MMLLIVAHNENDIVMNGIPGITDGKSVYFVI
jgi:hypothetical protein